ncbi:MAG: hypothetical protein ACPG8W_19790 [Candidatus Promineifilaceae bacterium]
MSGLNKDYETSEMATLSVMDGDRLYIAQKSNPSNNIQVRDQSRTHFPTLHVTSPNKRIPAYHVAL